MEGNIYLVYTTLYDEIVVRGVFRSEEEAEKLKSEIQKSEFGSYMKIINACDGSHSSIHIKKIPTGKDIKEEL